jgi:Uma2 family endonuclease
MNLQFELFPDFPRLEPLPPTLPAPKDWTWLEAAWATLDYPEDEENEDMPQNTLQGKLINYIKSVLDACLAYVDNGFAAADLFMHRTIQALNEEGKTTKQVEKLAPDVIFVQNVVPKNIRGSFDQQKEEKALREAWKARTGEEMPDEMVDMKILVVEIMSPSNYATVGDIWKRYQFYQREHVQEYLVIHTENDELYLEFFVNRGGVLMKMLDFPEHESALAKVIFKVVDNELILTTPDGDIFLHYEDERKMKQETQQKLLQKEELLEQERAEKERERAEKEKALTEKERERTEKEKALTEKERERTEKERERKLRLKLEADIAREREEEQLALEEMKRKLQMAEQIAQRLSDLN